MLEFGLLGSRSCGQEDREHTSPVPRFRAAPDAHRPLVCCTMSFTSDNSIPCPAGLGTSLRARHSVRSRSSRDWDSDAQSAAVDVAITDETDGASGTHRQRSCGWIQRRFSAKRASGLSSRFRIVERARVFQWATQGTRRRISLRTMRQPKVTSARTASITSRKLRIGVVQWKCS